LQVAAESRDAAVVSVYDPAMCCPTGVRGPSVEPEFARISKDLRWVESQGAKVERFNLAQEPEAFVQNRRVVGLMQAFGDGALPAVLVNGEVAAYGRYPSREEMLEAAKGSVGGGVGAGQTDEQAPRSSGCEPGSGCC
jgi:hypothetical protein